MALDKQKLHIARLEAERARLQTLLDGVTARLQTAQAAYTQPAEPQPEPQPVPAPAPPDAI